jgi:O-acetylhomoserine/O-acetylserine sulfhydrylase-like pyridoxal-dependent enzyme
LWHVYQGWFQDAENFPSSEAKTLHQLNLSSADETLVDSQRLATIIDHRASIRFMPETMSLQKLIRKNDHGADLVMDSAFNQLRNQNKEIIGELLTAEKLKSIGIG